MDPETGKAPNKYTIAMGELIRKAREDAGLSQEELAELIYRKRLAVSEMENGKVEISAWVIPYLALNLKKPISYFYPDFIKEKITKDEIDPLEHELLIYFRDIWDDHIRRTAIQQIKVLSEFDPEPTLIESFHKIAAYLQHEDEMVEYMKNRKKTK
jgi:transcriptional regulator with XRE-family HTH domain